MIGGRGRGRGRGRDLSLKDGDTDRQGFQHHQRISTKEEDFSLIPSRPPYPGRKENDVFVSGKKVVAPPSSSSGHNDQVVTGKEVETAWKVEPIQDVTKMMVVKKRFPNEFYMIRENDKFEFSKNIRVAAEFQVVMDKAEMTTDSYVVKPELQKCYTYQEPRSRTWLRVRLLKVTKAKFGEFATVYHIDREFSGVVPLRSLRQLPDKWLHPIVPVFRCHLYDVIPIKGGGDYHWSDEATAFFDKTVLENMNYFVCPISWSAAKVHGSLIDTRYDMGVLIFFPRLKKGPLRCVNYDMVVQGYGSAVGPGASQVDMLYLPLRVPEYKRLINRGSETSAFIVDKNTSSHQLARNHLSQIKFSHVVDPSSLFVQMSAMTGEFRAMEEDLGNAVKDLKPIPPSNFKVGLSVACALKGYAHAETTWNRAVIYDDAVCARTVRVILADYGEILHVPVSRVYPLPDQFQSIHSFVIRVHLNEIYPVDEQATSSRKPPRVWSTRVNSALDSLTSALEMDNPVYYAFQPSFTDVIKLKNIRKKLEFDMEQLKWKASETRAEERGALEDTHGSVRKNSLLTSHFYSFGVDIMYETEENHGLFAKQEYLTDLLLECAKDDVRLIKRRVNRKKYFGKLIELYDNQVM